MQQLQRQREEARLQGQKAVLARDKALRELKAEQQRQQQEQNVQAKLRKLGVCVAGFRWIRHRCGDDSHLVWNAQLGL